jgi:hypothetical protein
VTEGECFLALNLIFVSGAKFQSMQRHQVAKNLSVRPTAARRDPEMMERERGALRRVTS